MGSGHLGRARLGAARAGKYCSSLVLVLGWWEVGRLAALGVLLLLGGGVVYHRWVKGEKRQPARGGGALADFPTCWFADFPTCRVVGKLAGRVGGGSRDTGCRGRAGERGMRWAEAAPGRAWGL